MRTKSLFLVGSFLFYTTILLGQSVILDASFGDNGVVITDLGGDEDYCSIALQSDGKIVLAGVPFIFDGSEWRSEILVMRYNADGSLDHSFGEDGKVLTNINPESSGCLDIAIQIDGKILVAGVTDQIPDHDIIILRFNTDGSFDETFNGSGIARALYPGSECVESIAIQPDGKIVVGGTAYAHSPWEISMRVVRFNPDGSLDNTFDADGIVTVDFDTDGSGDNVKSVAIQSDGKIVAAGSFISPPNRHFAVIRLNTDGSLDNTFSEDGMVNTSIESMKSQGESVALQSDGKIVVGGVTGLFINPTDPPFFAAIRYNTDGTLDHTFGDEGVVVTGFGENSFDWAYSIGIQSDGKILLAGSSALNLPDTDGDFGLVRYNTDGTLDNTFGEDGLVAIDFGYHELGRSMVIQPDGNVVMAGSNYHSSDEIPTGSDRDYVLARYLVDLDVGVIDWSHQKKSILIYPNPIQSYATLQYELTKSEVLTLELFDMTGRLIQSIFTNEKRNKGKHQEELHFDNSMPSGNYFLTISSDAQSMSIKITKY